MLKTTCKLRAVTFWFRFYDKLSVRTCQDRPASAVLGGVACQNGRCVLLCRWAEMKPSFAEERTLWQQGYRFVAGIDEVGRGPLAGPVMAAAVILPRDYEAPWLAKVQDSKKLSPQSRESLCQLIREIAVAIGIGVVPPESIDENGIVAATRSAMSYAIAQLPQPPDFLLIDALALPEIDIPQRNIIRGDASSLSIAAASIVAKVARDQLMTELDAIYPAYGFVRNKGYPTPEHLSRLQRFGPCPLHRRSFHPVRDVVERGSHRP